MYAMSAMTAAAHWDHDDHHHVLARRGAEVPVHVIRIPRQAGGSRYVIRLMTSSQLD